MVMEVSTTEMTEVMKNAENYRNDNIFGVFGTEEERVIFSSINDITASFDYLEQYATKRLMDLYPRTDNVIFVKCKEPNNKTGSKDCYRGFMILNANTGTTTMLLAIISACNSIGIDLTVRKDGNDCEMWSKFY